MKQLSLLSINEKAPLKVSTASDAFMFEAEQTKYIVGFVEDEAIATKGVYQLFLMNKDGSKNTLSKEIYQTVVVIIEEFFKENDNAILYICDISDNRQTARDRLFSIWFNSYEKKEDFTLERTSVDFDGTKYHAAMLISNSNPHYKEFLNAFNDFTMKFKTKLN